ncbi:DUF397 domain-containing protein [Streptomyces turgidiscabies]|uniref:Putative toxin-antitoxin system, toxin component n=1 Tax=Streptomyces turgidiscabies (strain Car8) TaxID=698760 RepID=L7EZ93_STRT8|nr:MULTISPECIES: DUF397 domain-containing protein [Streptomyces]ELP64352.1 putative toxin-antitoxin system, toxin component [Streptomyces turgidiscabies Car8]MDX3494700.1 DUF397 domain-containing protein [Streptomyces turgidiscabies]GAQ71308.1 hypothetical protein T45_03050 [Streptomyces turgidiscabies]
MTALPRNVPSVVEPPGVRWLRSSYSTGANNCVETARPDTDVPAGPLAVRDSKNATGPVLLFSPESWQGFLTAFR